MIERFVTNSLNGDLYQKAIECLKALRETCVKEDEGAAFNKYMEKLKKKFQSGDNKDFFEQLIKKKISLITSKESSTSSMVSEEEAKKVILFKQSNPL